MEPLIETGDPSDAAVVDAGEVVPLRRVDHALDPLRRVLRFALEQPASVSYLAVTAQRHVRAAIEVGLPVELAEDLVEVSGDAEGLDHPDAETRRSAIREVNAALARVDAAAPLSATGPL